MSTQIVGRIDWDVQRDKEGHRDYMIKWLINSNTADGPLMAMTTPGLPLVGSPWAFGNDNDFYALCWPTLKANPVIANEPGEFWIVEQLFSTRPIKRCQDSSIQNPLSEPMRISGTFVKFTEEATHDRNGKAIKSVSHEAFTGKLVEFDKNKPTVRIGFNLMANPLSSIAPMIDVVNDSSLWGLSKRMIKLSNVTWERHVYGTCNFYYSVDYDFDIDYKTFDRKVWEQGTKVLKPGGDASNPKDFTLYRDPTTGDLGGRVYLTSGGLALTDGDNPVEKKIEKYSEGNLLSLGIPSTL